MRDVTVIRKFSGGSRFSSRRRLIPGSLFASKLPRKVWVGGAKTDFAHGRGKP